MSYDRMIIIYLFYILHFILNIAYFSRLEFHTAFLSCTVVQAAEKGLLTLHTKGPMPKVPGKAKQIPVSKPAMPKVKQQEGNPKAEDWKDS